MLNIKINEDDALQMLMNRVQEWTTDSVTCELFERYYRDMIDCGAFVGCDFDVSVIVDNDYVNYFDVKTPEELEHDYGTGVHVQDRIYAEYEGHYLVYVG